MLVLYTYIIHICGVSNKNLFIPLLLFCEKLKENIFFIWLRNFKSYTDPFNGSNKILRLLNITSKNFWKL